MSLTKTEKQKVVGDFQRKKGDTGSPEVQIALLTNEIEQLSGHIKSHPKDLHCRVGLMKCVSSRRSLLDYLKRTAPETYRDMLARLGLRR